MDLPCSHFEYSDKVYHATAGAIAGALSAYLVDRIIPDAPPLVKRVVAMVPVVALGVGKEVYDNQHRDCHDPDWKDAAATIGGGVVSMEIVLRW